MNQTPFDYEMHQSTYRQMHSAILKSMTEAEEQFLLVFEAGEPDWCLFAVPAIECLPAVRWKLLSIQSFRQADPARRAQSVDNMVRSLA